MSNVFSEFQHMSDVELADKLLTIQSDITFAFESEFLSLHASRLAQGDPAQVEWSIVDVGCGNGYHTAKLAALFPRSRVVALDSNPKLLDLARRNCAGRDNVSFVAADFLSDSDLDAGRFDLIHARSVLQYLLPAKADAFFTKAACIGRRDGLLALFDTDDAFAVAYPETAYLTAIQGAHGVMRSAALSGDRQAGRKFFHHAARAGFRDFDFTVFMANSIQHKDGRLAEFLHYLGVFLNRVSPQHFPEENLGAAYEEFAARWSEPGFFVTIPLFSFVARNGGA